MSNETNDKIRMLLNEHPDPPVMVLAPSTECDGCECDSSGAESYADDAGADKLRSEGGVPNKLMDVSLKAKTYAYQILEIAEILGVDVEWGAKVADIGKEVISKARQLTDEHDPDYKSYAMSCLATERQRMANEIAQIQTDAGGFVKALANALGIEWQSYHVQESLGEIRSKLVHLMGYEQSLFLAPNETGKETGECIHREGGTCMLDYSLCDGCEDECNFSGAKSYTDDENDGPNPAGTSDEESKNVSCGTRPRLPKTPEIANREGERESSLIKYADLGESDENGEKGVEIDPETAESAESLQDIIDRIDEDTAQMLGDIAHLVGFEVSVGMDNEDIYKGICEALMDQREVSRYHRELKRMLGTTKNLRDALKAKLDSMPNMTKERDAWQKKAWKWEEKCLERDSRIDALLDLIRDAAEEYKDKHYWAQVWHDRAEDMRMERDELQAKLDEYDRTHVELPKGMDADQITSLCEQLDDANVRIDELSEQCVDHVMSIGRLENELDRLRGVTKKKVPQRKIDVSFVPQSVELVRCTADPADAIASAARVCTQSRPKDGMSIVERLNAQARLVASLIKNQHLSPVEFADADFLLEVDRGIQQELTRHRHFSYQVESTRWVDYRRKPMRCVTKPPRGMSVPKWYVSLTEELCELSALVYEVGLDAGVPRDYARKSLPLALASSMRMKGNFRMWYEMLPKRLGKTAHPEAREVAARIQDTLAERCPAVFDEVSPDE